MFLLTQHRVPQETEAQGKWVFSTFFLTFRDYKHHLGEWFQKHTTHWRRRRFYLSRIPGNNSFLSISQGWSLLLLSFPCFNSLPLSSLPRIYPKYSTDQTKVDSCVLLGKPMHLLGWLTEHSEGLQKSGWCQSSCKSTNPYAWWPSGSFIMRSHFSEPPDVYRF